MDRAFLTVEALLVAVLVAALLTWHFVSHDAGFWVSNIGTAAVLTGAFIYIAHANRRAL